MLALRVQPALQAAAAHQREDEARRLAREAVAEQRQQVRVRAAGEEGDLEEM